MTFNIRQGKFFGRWGKRRAAVCNLLGESDCDFIGVQEAWKFQINDICASLGKYQYIGRSRGKDPVGGEWCPLFYDASEWVIDQGEQGTFWLSKTPETAGSKSWGSSLPRIVTWGRFINIRSGRAVYVYNTHFDHLGQRMREESAKLVCERISQRKYDDAAILLGDFNAGENNRAILTISEAMTNAFRSVNGDAEMVGTHHGFKGKTNGKMIDYVFVSEGLVAVSAKILHDNSEGRYPSDHFPVVAGLQIK